MTTNIATSNPLEPVDVDLRIPQMIYSKFSQAEELIKKYHPNLTLPVEDLISFYLFKTNHEAFAYELATEFLEFVYAGTNQEAAA